MPKKKCNLTESTSTIVNNTIEATSTVVSHTVGAVVSAAICGIVETIGSGRQAINYCIDHQCEAGVLLVIPSIVLWGPGMFIYGAKKGLSSGARQGFFATLNTASDIYHSYDDAVEVANRQIAARLQK